MISTSLWAIILIFVIVVVIAGFSIYRWQSRRRKGSDSFVKGLLAIVEHDSETAIKHLKNAATQDTQNIEAFIILGDVLRQQGEITKAKQIHTSLLARAFISAHQKARVYKSLALDAAKEGKFGKAAEYIRQALTISPDRWAQQFLLDMLEKLERWDEAFRLLSKTDGDEKILALYKVEYGKSIIDTDPHKARVSFKDALKLDSDCIPAMLLIGDAYAAEGKMKNAVEWWVKIMERFPEHASIVIQRLEGAYYELGEFDNARALYQKILKTHPDADVIRLELAQIFEKMGELELADTTLSQTPDSSPIIAIAKAKLKCMQNNADEAKKILEEVMYQLTQREYKCSSCGYASQKPLWHCPECGDWRTFGI